MLLSLLQPLLLDDKVSAVVDGDIIAAAAAAAAETAAASNTTPAATVRATEESSEASSTSSHVLQNHCCCCCCCCFVTRDVDVDDVLICIHVLLVLVVNTPSLLLFVPTLHVTLLLFSGRCCCCRSGRGGVSSPSPPRPSPQVSGQTRPVLHNNGESCASQSAASPEHDTNHENFITNGRESCAVRCTHCHCAKQSAAATPSPDLNVWGAVRTLSRRMGYPGPPSSGSRRF